MTGLTFEYILARDSKEPHCSDLPRSQRADMIGDIQRIADYAEPGYRTPDAGILLGNWNYFSRTAANILERAGYSLEWDDEWSTCDECGKAVRTSPDGYDWQPSYVTLNDCELMCLSCVDWPSYLASIEDDSDTACMAACNPAEHGYTLISEPAEYESGWHPGQTNKPADILRHLHAQGKTGIVFRIPETSQFYITFEVWQRQEDSSND